MSENSAKFEGVVKWFDEERGYGFIKPDGSGEDVFVHITEVRKAGYAKLEKGDIIEYDTFEGKNGKPRAKDLTVYEYVYE